jgi:hypothetical protein
LNTPGQLSLEGDLTLASNATLPNGGVIDGQGKAIFLNGNLLFRQNKLLNLQVILLLTDRDMNRA